MANILINIFMVDFEQGIIVTLPNDVSLWKRYVDDTFCFAKSDSINHVIESLNDFHSNIKFTIQREKDILLIYNKSFFNTTVYCKKTNTDLYIDWKSFHPNNWKWRILKTLVSRVYDICSAEKYLKEELNHIETVFKHQSYYPSSGNNKVVKQVQQGQKVPSNTANEKENGKKKIHR